MMRQYNYVPQRENLDLNNGSSLFYHYFGDTLSILVRDKIEKEMDMFYSLMALKHYNIHAGKMKVPKKSCKWHHLNEIENDVFT